MNTSQCRTLQEQTSQRTNTRRQRPPRCARRPRSTRGRRSVGRHRHRRHQHDVELRPRLGRHPDRRVRRRTTPEAGKVLSATLERDLSMAPSSADRPPVFGAAVDQMTRCVHYRGATDIVAIRFACCGDYYPCHHCHEESAGHAAEQWAPDQHDRKAILCGACGHELTIAEYLSVTTCPTCSAQFNERCVLHRHHYFHPNPS